MCVCLLCPTACPAEYTSIRKLPVLRGGEKCFNCDIAQYYDIQARSCEVCPTGQYQDEVNQLNCKNAPVPLQSGTFEGDANVSTTIFGVDAQPYAGPAYEYTAQTLASFNVLCSSIKNQCDKGLNGLACSNGQPSGQKANCPQDEASMCVTTGCQAYLECVYPSCSCSCDAGYYGIGGATGDAGGGEREGSHCCDARRRRLGTLQQTNIFKAVHSQHNRKPVHLPFRLAVDVEG